MLEIFLDDPDTLPAFVYKNSRVGTSAECFDSQAAGSCKQVQYRGPLNEGGDNIEKRFLDPIGGRPGGIPFDGFQLVSPGCAGYYTQNSDSPFSALNRTLISALNKAYVSLSSFLSCFRISRAASWAFSRTSMSLYKLAIFKSGIPC